MTTIPLDHLRQHVRMEVQKHLEGKSHRRPWVAMAYRGIPGWSGPQNFEEKGFHFRVAVANSLLDLRCHLVGIDPFGQERVVIVADLPQTQFQDDIRSRLLHSDLREIDPVHLLMAEFKAVRFDARIKADQNLALALLQNRPAGGFPAVTTGVLDFATIWGCVCTYVLGLPNSDPTPRDLLVWSIDDTKVSRLRVAAASIRAASHGWLTERNPLSALLVSIASKVSADDLIPIGIVCGIVHHENAAQHPDLLRAQGRLEQITGHEQIALKDAREWHAEATQALGQLEIETQLRLRKRSDTLIEKVGATDFAYLSDIAPVGYSQRLVNYANTLRQHLQAKTTDAALLNSAQAVRLHWDGQVDKHRQLKMEMATRIARWLQTPVDEPRSLPEAMRMYRDRLAFVDWARHGVVGGDSVAELQQVYASLHEKALSRREVFNRRFAELVVDWNRTPDQYSDVLRIEDINRRVVAEVASDHKVLVLVMDGMSWAVAQELVGHLERQYWTLRNRTADGINMPSPVMTTLPSVTEYGRTSLLCGNLIRGDAADERRGFAENHELRSVSSSSNPPMLFHKKDLEEAGRQGLGAQIADAIANPKQRVVGVVVNSVDDHLAKDDGGRRSWEPESIRVLGDILVAADQAKRAIILCSDHGHVLDHWVAGASGTLDGGERWHTGAPKDGELVVGGPRIAAYGSTITAPWSERLRYGGKKNGYHGGISPQELIAPCLVLAKLEDTIEGWSEINLAQPPWWRLDTEAVSAVVITPVASKSTKTKPRVDPPGQQRLFGDHTPPPDSTSNWPQRLLASSVYQMSSTQAGRRRPDDTVVLKLLAALDAAPGCQLSERALAEVLNVPAVRMSVIISQVARLLNVESYRILSYTDDRGHIRLDRILAFTQFELGAAP